MFARFRSPTAPASSASGLWPCSIKGRVVRAMLGTAALVFALAAALYFGLRESWNQQPTQEDIRSGKLLAKTHCSKCHSTPDPHHLPVDHWPEALDWMGNYLGFRNVDGGLGRLVDESLIPPNPFITVEQLAQIRSYYLLTSPSQAELLKDYPVRPQAAVTQFTPYHPQFKLPSDELISMIHIDEQRGHYYIGLGQETRLHVYDRHQNQRLDVKVASQPIHVETTASGCRLSLIGDLWEQRKKGQILDVETDGWHFKPQTLVAGFYRLVESHVRDFNQDGWNDLLIVAFGEGELGRVSVLWGQTGGGYRVPLTKRYDEEILVDYGGALGAQLHDLDDNGHEDILILTAQRYQELLVFLNQGNGQFERHVLLQNFAGFGFNQFSLADFNHDGQADLVLVNGNNMELEPPVPLRPYHGVRILLNRGDLRFEEVCFIPLHGAMKAIPEDFDQDGDVDLATIAYFPDWAVSPPETFVYLENRGDFDFAPSVLDDRFWGRWLTMDSGDVDRDGDQDIMLGAGNSLLGISQRELDTYEKLKKDKPPVVILKNSLR